FCRRESLCRAVRRRAQSPAGSDAWWGRNHVSGISHQGEIFACRCIPPGCGCNARDSGASRTSWRWRCSCASRWRPRRSDASWGTGTITMKNLFLKISTFAAVTVFASAAFAVLISAQQPQIRTPRQMPMPANPDFSKLEVWTWHVQGTIHLIAGAGGNIVVQAGDDGVLMVDTGYDKMSDKVMAALKKISTKP